jgi:hypothetical protein
MFGGTEYSVQSLGVKTYGKNLVARCRIRRKENNKRRFKVIRSEGVCLICLPQDKYYGRTMVNTICTFISIKCG